MRVIELSEYRDDEGLISLENRIRGTLDFGFRWYSEMEAQHEITERLRKNLDNDHLLLRNATIPGTEIVIPLLLLSPQGARVLVPLPAKGIFRAKEDEWSTFDGRSRRFKRSRPNMQTISSGFAQAVHTYLQGLGVPLPEVEPVIICTNPRAHVDTAHPSVRVIQSDAIAHFATNMQRFQPIMDREDIDMIRDLILRPQRPQAQPLEAPSFEDEIIELSGEFDEAPSTDVDPFRLEDSPAAQRSRRGPFGFTTGQWVILGALLVIELLIVAIFAAILFADRLFVFFS